MPLTKGVRWGKERCACGRNGHFRIFIGSFHHSFRVRFHSWNLPTLSQCLVWGTDCAMHLGEDIKEISCGPCPYGNFCQAGRKKKFLHMKLLTNIWGIISTRKKKCVLCQTRTDNLSPYVTSSGCFRMLICSTGLRLFSPSSQKNVLQSIASWEGGRWKKRDK